MPGRSRPDGPYGEEMTAGPAWPGLDEMQLLTASEIWEADRKAVEGALEEFGCARTRLFVGPAAKWSGDAADAAQEQHRGVIAELRAQLRGSAAAAKLCGDGADIVRSTKIQVIDNTQNAQQWIEKFSNDPRATSEQKDWMIQALVKKTHAENVALVQDGAAKLGEPKPAPIEVRPADFVHDAPLAPPPGPDRPPPQIPTNNVDPKKVKRWWGSLSPEEQSRLLRDYPDKLGNLNGVLVVDRDHANRAVMQQDLDRVTRAATGRHVPVEEVTAHPQNYGLTPADVTRYTNAVQVKQGLEENRRLTRNPTFLQVYEPEKFNGQGRAAIAIGDPDKAANTAVVVPGTSHSVTEGWLSSNDAANLYNETKNADPASTRSVVAWMGYNAPDSLKDLQVAQTGNAHEGGALLAADVNALNTTHVGASDVTVIGHSYGSTTVADAAAGYGMHAHDVVLIGCPGTDMAHSAADFHLAPGGHVYVGAASTDPIARLGLGPQLHVPLSDVTLALGHDPAVEGFGSTRFKAEVPGLTFNDHSHYYDPGSESLFSMADIASGHGNALQEHGMTASHRDTALGLIVGDSEQYRPGTTGHYHGER
jgi:hypothetical protein